LVSRDVNTMPGHFVRFLEERGSSPGILLVPSTRPVGAVIEALLVVWLNWTEEDMRDQARWLP
jgi:hypothetical protein